MNITADTLRSINCVADFRVWEKGNRSRTYIELIGYDGSYSGCRNHQLYIDNKTGNLINERGRGMVPSAYNEAIEEFETAIAQEKNSAE